MLLYHHSDFVLHDTGPHPESKARILRVNEMLAQQGWTASCTTPDWQPATQEQCTRNHPLSYLQKLKSWCQEDAGRVEVDTVVSKDSWQAASLAAGAVCDAVDRVMDGSDRLAFCAIRPPGHHALPDSAMGFCLLNNVAIGALHARARGLERVMIIDWDVHHGNGTQDAFWTDPSVGFVSIHRYPFYPGTGSADETGQGKGLGTTVNIPVPASTGPKEFLERLFESSEKLAHELKPQLILLSAGFDAHRQDPVGGLTLESEHFRTAGEWIAKLARDHCEGRLVSLLEGGYHLQHMPDCVHAHLQGMTKTA